MVKHCRYAFKLMSYWLLSNKTDVYVNGLTKVFMAKP